MTKLRAAILSTLLLPSASALAVEPGFYGAFGAGISLKGDSSNSGQFTSPFTTGEGTTIPGGTVLPAGTPLGWETEFSSGYSVMGAFGYTMESGFSGEFEIGVISNDVKGHSGVNVGGTNIDGEDAGVLITGSGNLGTTVGELVAAGRGDVQTTTYMLNALYHFQNFGKFQPYVGGGIGLADVKVAYKPSEVVIADNSDDGFAWQLKIGGEYAVSEELGIFVEYRYLQVEEASIPLSLLPATLEVENTNNSFNAGIRYRF
jgi:opacity protein-like surface antigen